MKNLLTTLISIFFNIHSPTYKMLKPWVKILLKIIVFPILYLIMFYSLSRGFNWNFHSSVLLASAVTYITFIIYVSFKYLIQFMSFILFVFPYLIIYSVIVCDLKKDNKHYIENPDHIIKDSCSVKLIKNDVMISSVKVEHYNNPNVSICYDTHLDGFGTLITSNYYVCLK